MHMGMFWEPKEREDGMGISLWRHRKRKWVAPEVKRAASNGERYLDMEEHPLTELFRRTNRLLVANIRQAYYMSLWERITYLVSDAKETSRVVIFCMRRAERVAISSCVFMDISWYYWCWILTGGYCARQRITLGVRDSGFIFVLLLTV